MERIATKGSYVSSSVGQIRAGVVSTAEPDYVYVHWFIGMEEDDVTVKSYMEYVPVTDLQVLDPARATPGLKLLRRKVIK